MAASNCVTINCNNVVFGGNCVGVVAINCVNKVFDSRDNSKIFISNTQVSNSTSVLVNAASGPPTINGTYGTYYIDASGGSIPVYLGDPALMKDCKIYFFRLDNSASLITFTAFNSENLNQTALPQNLLPNQNDHILLTSDGTDWFILG